MITEFKTKFVRHSDMKSDEIQKIISVKQQYWDYSFESQMKWINDNLFDDDYHLWFELNTGEIIAYLNIVNLDVRVDESNKRLLGIGNVCVDKNVLGNGLGKLLMQTANYYIKNTNEVAILLCKKHLLGFYQKAGWHVYNGDMMLQKVIFKDIVMFSKVFHCSSIFINRNF